MEKYKSAAVKLAVVGICIGLWSGGILFGQAVAANDSIMPGINPSLKFATLEIYEAECKEPGIMLDDARMTLFAPKRKAKEAEIIFGCLLKAYDELYRKVGMYPRYKLVVYHFPDGSEYGWGGTSECAIWYGYNNLDLDAQEEWIKYKVPHVSGYIEEMAHNFVSTSGAQFGWEMIGWNLGIKATKKVAGNPLLTAHENSTRRIQAETVRRYVDSGYIFPSDIASNLCDRVHSHLLWLCENRYGPGFWEDVFAEIRKESEDLRAAASLGDSDIIRNRRYQMTVDCFDRLPKIEFKRLLEKYRISLAVDIQSLHPTDPNWNRTFMEPDDYDAGPQKAKAANPGTPLPVGADKLPPLHKAAYAGHPQTCSDLIDDGADVNEKAENGWTPLHLAAIGGHRIVSEVLLSKGTKIKALDDEGRTAARLAEICGHNGLAQFLRGRE